MFEISRIFPELEKPNALRELAGSFSVTRPVVIFAISARVGSTGLLSLLSCKFGFSFIFEIFNPRGVADAIARDNNLPTFEAYLRHIDRTMIGDILAFKVSWNDFEFLDQSDAFRAIFPNVKFIYLDRVDLEAQAMSLYIASTTQVWHVPLDANKQEQPDLKYDRYRIDGLLRHLQATKMSWMKFFGRNKMVPLTLYYEAIRTCAQHALLAICKESGIQNVTLDDMPDWQDGKFGLTSNDGTEALLRQYLADRYPRRPQAAVPATNG